MWIRKSTYTNMQKELRKADMLRQKHRDIVIDYLKIKEENMALKQVIKSYECELKNKRGLNNVD